MLRTDRMDMPLNPDPYQLSTTTAARLHTSGRPPADRRSSLGPHWFVGPWIAAVLSGVLVLAYHSSIPGKAARPPKQIASGPETGPAEKARLLLFLHPKCPCSRATLGELAKIVSRREKKLDTQVFFYRPAGFSSDWEKTDLWQMAENIPGVRAMADVDGAVARRFEARTSGQSFLYDGAGRLVFSGGLTAARGHSGDNPGESAIISWLKTGQISPENTPVFGCPLFQEPSVP
ncbi:MAG TPA: hypothetical protein VG826_08580 [Pirellulales bacterium]|nr:hypothetical protein [Pirellulales bacterium]